MAEGIGDIDALSFAAQTGHVAAAELYGLLTDADGPVVNWFGGGGSEIPRAIADMASFLAAEDLDKGEVLWLEGTTQGWIRRSVRSFAELPWSERLVLEVFARTTMQIYRAIHGDQQALEAAARAAAQSHAMPALKREDSILEHEEALDKRVEGLEYMPGIDGPPAGGPPRPETAARNSAKPVRTRSIGETGVKPPVNRGGRGNRKSG